MTPETATAWRREETVTIASAEVTEALLVNPKVSAGLAAYFERYDRHDGVIPTISGEELDQRLAD